MNTALAGPTLYPDVNALVARLVAEVRPILGERLVGLYLDGSLATGDFDEDSDIDFVAVTDPAVDEGGFLALQAMHDRIATLDSPLALELEGFYVPPSALRQGGRGLVRCPNIERGRGERLKWVELESWWAVHRRVLYAHGITVIGPPPRALTDPVTSDELLSAMTPLTSEWLPEILQDPTQMATRGYQSYIVLTLCRILYTMAQGDVASKAAASRWARGALPAHWTQLIDDAWVDRHHPAGAPSADAVKETLAFIRFTIATVDSTSI